MRKLLIGLVGLIIFAGCVAGYLWYDTKIQMDKAVAWLSPYAKVSYGSVHVSLLGTVRLDDIVIQPRVIEDSIRIESLRFEFPNLFAVLASNQEIKQDKWPKALALTIDQLRFDLNSPLLRQILPPRNVPHANACGDVLTLTPAELQAMGYDRLAVGLTLQYNLNEVAGLLDTALKLDAHDLLALTAEATFMLNSASLSIKQPLAEIPRLVKMNLTIKDESLNGRKNRFCAKQGHVDVAEAIAEQVRLSTESMSARGITLGAGIVEAYRRYLTQGGQLTLASNPKRPVELAAMIPSDDAANMLGLALRLNGEPVNDLVVVLRSPQPVSVAPSVSAPAPATDGTAVAPPPTQPETSASAPEKAATEAPHTDAAPTDSPEPLTLDISKLYQYVGKTVLVNTLDGREYRGHIDGLANDVLRLSMKIQKGTAGFSIRIDNIVSVTLLETE